ncbi:hypothetical protein L195_g023102 [Trifolium pratense]|uniref:Uncharacterized protein n=1 Tax=Trifolium pratense TaxID=57577 RepID=A0A2K3KWL3_TRIPR|nr:hypothetical protein L195_g057635 [Trifolium pratense]PNX99832.1 hypothetical protein L195_g023102 [Trifolium pratense]
MDAHSMCDGSWGLGLLLPWEDESCVGAAKKVVIGGRCVSKSSRIKRSFALD